jgi:hypothetical protein
MKSLASKGRGKKDLHINGPGCIMSMIQKVLDKKDPGYDASIS